MLGQPADRQQRLGRAATVAVGLGVASVPHVGWRGGAQIGGIVHRQPLLSIAERRPSDSRLKAIEVMKIMAPGSAAIHGCT